MVHALALTFLAAAAVQGFSPLVATGPSSMREQVTCHAAGQGFGKSRVPPKKTYGQDIAPVRDVIDVEAAMNTFFTAREDWIPLFRTMATSTTCAAIDFLGHIDEEIDFHEDSNPWRRLPAIPDAEDDRTVLASFLDESQTALVSIPVDERTKEDDNDLQFVEEGRRLLALNRFHVLKDNHGGTVQHADELFSTCWNELMHLGTEDEQHTGSLIILPQHDHASLRRFTDMNVLQPLEWLGIHADFEVASLSRGPAIRLLYKLSDIPEPQQAEGQTE